MQEETNDINQYPAVVVVNSPSGDDDIHALCLDVDLSNSRWGIASILPLPEHMHPGSILDLCAGALPGDIKGVYCLYELQGQVQLSFAGFRSGAPQDPYSRSLRVPQGARSLGTFVNQEGFTDLLVGGNGLAHYTAAAIAQSDTPTGSIPYTIVLTDEHLVQVQQLIVAQQYDQLSVFCRNGDDTVLYQRFQNLRSAPQASPLVADGPLVPLFRERKDGGHMAALLHAATGSQRLFTIGRDNTLMLLEQSGDTHIWQHTSLLVPSIAKIKDVLSYTTHIHLASDHGLPLQNAEVLLCSSPAANVGYNGRSIWVTPDGTSITTDMSGDITLIHHTQDLSSVVFTLKDVPKGAPVLKQTHTIDPAEHAQRILSSISSADDLRAVSLSQGGKLIDESQGTVSQSDLDKGAQAIMHLAATLGKMPQDGSDHPERAAEEPQAIASGETTHWSFWHWVKEKAAGLIHKVEDFFVEGFHWVLTIAGKVYRFLLKGLSYVWKAIHTVLQDVLHIPIDKIIEWLGFVFEWSDIKETHNMIVAMANAAVGCAIDKVHDLRDTVDKWFEQADNMIQSLDQISPDARDRFLNSTAANTQTENNDKYAKVQNSPGAKWSSYQVQYGGVGHSLSRLSHDQPSSVNPLLQFWESMGPALAQISTSIQDVFKDVMKLFASKKEVSLGQLLEHLGVDLLRNILKVIHKIFDGFIDFMAAFMGDMRVMMNAVIDIPLLSPLYRRISDNDLTALDAISLLIAVPTTVVFKALTGEAPSHGLGDLTTFLQEYSSAHVHTRSTPSKAPKLHAKFALSQASTVSQVTGISDETIQKIEKVALRLVIIATPLVNTVLLIIAPFDWYTPDQPEQSNGKVHWIWKMAVDLVLSALTFPYKDIPNHSDFVLCRRLSWGLNTLTMFVRWAPVHARGLMALATGFFKLVPEVANVTMTISAAKEISGDLPPQLEWIDVTDRICSCAFLASGGVCMMLTKPEPYSAIAAVSFATIAIAAQTAKGSEAGDHFTDFSPGSFVGAA